MQRFLPIPLLVGIILGSASLVLLLAMVQASKNASARSALTDLVEQRLAMSRIARGLKENLTDLQRAARLYANTAEPRYLSQHEELLQRFQQRRDLLADPAPSLDSVLPDLHDEALMEFLGELNLAGFRDRELKSLSLALGIICDLGERQKQVLAAEQNRPDRLLALTSPQLEHLARQLGDHIHATDQAVQQRIDQAATDQHALIEILQRQLLALLGFIGLMLIMTLLMSQRYAVRPLRHLLAAATAIGSGQYATRARIFGVREIAELATTLNWMADSFKADLDARTRAEQRAQTTEQRLRQINDSTPGVMWEIHQNENQAPQLSYIGGAFEKIYAVSRERVMEDFSALLEAIHEEDRPRLLRAIQNARRKHSDFSNEHRALRADGQYRWIRSLGQLQTREDGRTVWSGYSFDIQELTELRTELEKALAAAEQGNRAKAQFLANLSHEIRTPMNAILGMTHLTLETDLSPKQFDYLQRIDTSARMLLQIINDILDVSKIDARRLDLEQVEFAIEPLIHRVFDVVGMRAQEKGLELRLKISPQVPRLLIGDALRLGQILINLLGNAIKFTDRGHVELALDLARQNDSEVRLRFAVQDTGPGISAQNQSRLFSAFTQADSSTTRKYGGTGLGLTIARSLARLMDGDISLQSSPGQGSTFSLEARFGIAADAIAKLRQAAQPPRRCLVISDNGIFRELVRSALQHCGHRCLEASQGDSALALCAEHPIEIVMLDWRLSEGSSGTLARQLSATPGWQGKILMLGENLRDQAMRQMETTLNFDAIVAEPVSAQALLDAIQAAYAGDQAGALPSSRGDQVPDLSQRRIMLVEDDATSLELAHELLRRTGADVQLAGSGREAIDMARQARPDLILLDLQLPDMNGFDVASALRQLHPGSIPPIVVLSADPSQQARCKDPQAPLDGFISKPIHVPTLYQTLEQHLAGALPSSRGTAATTTMLELPGVDTAAGLARASHNRALYGRLLQQFCDQNADIAAQMSAALHAQNWPTLQSLAHRLKGAAGNLGANDIARSCISLEAQLETGHAELARLEIETLGSLLDALTQALQLRAAPRGEPQAAADALPLLDAEALHTLTTLIEAGDASARQICAGYRARPDQVDLFKSIQHHLSNYAFEEAAQQLALMKPVPA